MPDKAYMVIRNYYDGENFYESNVALFKDETEAGLRVLHLQEAEENEDTDYHIQTWELK